jgi:hypothetical protein
MARIRSCGRADAADRRGQGASVPGQTDQLGPGAEARARGRGESSWIQIGGLRSDPH